MTGGGLQWDYSNRIGNRTYRKVDFWRVRAGGPPMLGWSGPWWTVRGVVVTLGLRRLSVHWGRP